MAPLRFGVLGANELYTPFPSVLPLWLRILEFKLLKGGRGSSDDRVAGGTMLLLSTPRTSDSTVSAEEPDSPESVVWAAGRSITLGDLMISKTSSSSCREKRTDRGETSALMAGRAEQT